MFSGLCFLMQLLAISTWFSLKCVLLCISAVCIYFLACLNQIMLSLVSSPSINAYLSLSNFSHSLNVNGRSFWAFIRVLRRFQAGVAVKYQLALNNVAF